MHQQTTPLLIQKQKATPFEKISLSKSSYLEDWIQNLCYDNPGMLPIEEIEPAFDGLVSICMELSVGSNSIDLIYVNEKGMITIGECKLWRNPEARRKVVGQILDYAKDLNGWTYEFFQQKCIEARKGTENSIYDIVHSRYPEVDESSFIDNVQRNLRQGRFLLAIIGDGIREETQQIAQYLDSGGHLNFTLGLIELPVYKQAETDTLVIVPRIIARTVEVEKTVYKIKELSPGEKVPEVSQEAKSQTISEQVFYERLATNIGQDASDEFKTFVNRLVNELYFKPTLGRGNSLSLNLKSSESNVNFASIQETGEVWFYGVVTKTGELGNRSIGIEYLKKLSVLVDGVYNDQFSEWMWCIKSKADKYIDIKVYLEKKEEWYTLISESLKKIQSLMQ